MAFKHQRHNIILSILQGMDLAFLNQAGAYFAGGTADIFLQGSDNIAQLLELSHAHHP